MIGLLVSQIAVYIVYIIVVGDSCRFHAPQNDVPNWFIRVFFPIPVANFHPEPGALIHGLFAAFGCIGGILFRLRKQFQRRNP